MYTVITLSLLSEPVAEDGQQMFLHPVNVRCLLRQYGSLENSPQSITATVVEVDGQTVTEVVHLLTNTNVICCSSKPTQKP